MTEATEIERARRALTQYDDETQDFIETSDEVAEALRALLIALDRPGADQ